MIMTKENNCTSFEQALELEKFLPKDSADMYWQDIGCATIPTFEIVGGPNYPKDTVTLCWSLNALMELLPETVTAVNEENYTDYLLNIFKADDEWTIFYEEAAHDLTYKDWLIEESGDNLIDVCYKVLVELHNKNLL